MIGIPETNCNKLPVDNRNSEWEFSYLFCNIFLTSAIFLYLAYRGDSDINPLPSINPLPYLLKILNFGDLGLCSKC